MASGVPGRQRTRLTSGGPAESALRPLMRDVLATPRLSVLIDRAPVHPIARVTFVAFGERHVMVRIRAGAAERGRLQTEHSAGRTTARAGHRDHGVMIPDAALLLLHGHTSPLLPPPPLSPPPPPLKSESAPL